MLNNNYAFIGYETNNGLLAFTHCQNFGQPSITGLELIQNYNTRQLALKLIYSGTMFSIVNDKGKSPKTLENISELDIVRNINEMAEKYFNQVKHAYVFTRNDTWKYYTLKLKIPATNLIIHIH